MSILRIGGIASGFDTEQIIKDLMRVERMKVDKSYQKRQVFEWQKDQFRFLTNKVRSFRDTYFDILKPETNILHASNLKKMEVTSSDPAVVTARANADAATGTTEFEVLQSATAAKAAASGVTGAGGEHLSLEDTMAAVSTKLAGGPLSFDENGEFTMTINDTPITVNENDTLRTVLSRINTSTAGVQASYSSFSDTFTFTAKETGEQFITVDDGGNFFVALGLKTAGGQPEIGEAGRDALFKIDGFEGTRTSNNFTIDGITYSINQQIDAPTAAIQINVSVDANAVYNTIESFVNDYNQLIDDISSKLSEERFRGFPPLTDEQKEAMNEKDIEKWEEKAQSGLLRRDPALEALLDKMRTAMYDAVGSEHLTAIGIETSSNYLDNGKLVLKNGGADLRAAIEQNPDMVVELFTKQSETDYSPNLTAEERASRYEESGLAHRISDILNDNVRTTRDNGNRKGTLLERAGIEGDISEFNNYFNKQINQVNERIDKVNEMLIRKENQYYRQFTAMEKALQQLYAQGDWLASQLQQNQPM
ncbi:MAG: flagellar filament capping protein FliD [Bacillota bacterium]|nr:flagellar filament capping protein FliD [Bacillota bacterium]MDW7684686.1 flagellar filament capping protein FliD [Bacillota bacterium]